MVSVSKCCPYYDDDTTTHAYDDERLVDLCGGRINISPEGAVACPMLVLGEGATAQVSAGDSIGLGVATAVPHFEDYVGHGAGQTPCHIPEAEAAL